MIAIRTARQTSDLPALITRDGQLSLAVAYITQDGLNHIKEDLQSALAGGPGFASCLTSGAAIATPGQFGIW